MTFDEWKVKAEAVAIDLLGLNDLFTEKDLYDLREAAEASYKDGVSPQGFVEEMFADDLASRENDSQMEAESLEEEFF